jgi:hypothetical protein
MHQALVNFFSSLCPVSLRTSIPELLHGAADLMIQNAADCGWFTDGRILLRNLDQYLPALQNVCLAVEYFSFRQREYTPTPGMKQTIEWEAAL